MIYERERETEKLFDANFLCRLGIYLPPLPTFTLETVWFVTQAAFPYNQYLYTANSTYHVHTIPAPTQPSPSSSANILRKLQ